MKQAVLWIVFVLLVSSSAFVAYYGLVPPFVWTSTEHTPGYSEARFKEIGLGDSRDKVIAALGYPFGITSAGFDESQYKYAMPTHGIARFWKQRLIIVSNDVVVEVRSGYLSR